MEKNLSVKRVLTASAASLVFPLFVLHPTVVIAGMAQVEPGEAGTLDTVVVTARRRNERLQDVPLAVTVIPADALDRARIDRLDEIQRLVPGFSVTPTVIGNGAFNPAIRSQRQTLANMVFDQSVSVYLAEVVQARPQGINTGLFDVASVQVLKGPQGTVFGRNSTGGAVLITPRAPEETFGGYAKATVGAYSLRQGEGVVNLPVNDSFQVRIGGKITRRDGYTHSYTTGRDLDDEMSEAWRLSLRFAPPDSRVTNVLALDGTHEHDNGTAFTVASVGTTGILQTLSPTGLYPVILSDFNTRQNSLPFHSTFSNARGNGIEIHTYAASNITEYHISDGINFKNIAGFRDTNSYIFYDIDGARFDIIDNVQRLKAKQYSDEFQVLGDLANRQINYIAGGYIFKESGTDYSISNQFVGTAAAAVGRKSPYVKNRSEAVFAQVTYRPEFLHNVSFTGGLRKTWDHRKLIGNSDTTRIATRVTTCTLLSADVGGVPLSPCRKDVSTDFSALTYTLTADWKPAPDTLLYLTNSTGYRTGGFQASAVKPSDFIPYKPERVTNYEVGLKTSWNIGGSKGWTGIAVYHQKYTNIQKQLGFVNELNVLVSSIINAAAARVDGFEIENSWRPVRGIEVMASYAYSDPKYKDYKFRPSTTSGIVDYSKAPFANVPKSMVSGSIRYDIPAGEEVGDFSAQVSGSYTSRRLVSELNGFDPSTGKVNPDYVLHSYKTFDARIEWARMLKTNTTVAIWVKNLSNEQYYTAFPSNVGEKSGILGDPRTYGVTLNYTF